MFFLRRAWLTDKQYSQCCFTANSDDGLFCTPCMRRAVNIIKYRISYLNNINRMYNKTVFLICGPAKTISSIWLIDWSLLKHVANVHATNVTTVTMNQDTWEKKIKTQKKYIICTVFSGPRDKCDIQTLFIHAFVITISDMLTELVWFVRHS